MSGLINSDRRPPVMGGSRWPGVFAKLQEYVTKLDAGIDKLRIMQRPDVTPFPVEVATAHGTYIVARASNSELRRAMFETPKLQRAPVQFASWKKAIDTITGRDCSIWQGQEASKSFTVGASFVAGIDTLGPAASSTPIAGRLVTPPVGTIMINLDNPGPGAVPTQDIINQLARRLFPLTGIYLPLTLGVVTNFNFNGFVIGTSVIGGADTIGNGLGAGTYYSPFLRLAVG